MQCIILAGGLGTRVSHRTGGRPKAMIEVAGEPFIRHQLRLLRDNGVNDVVVCTGHRAELIEAEMADHAPRGMTVRFSHDGRQLLGTGGAIRRAVADGLADEVFMVLHGDSYLRIDFADMWEWFDSEHHRALMAVWHNDDEFDASNAAVRNGRVVVYRRSSSKTGHPTMNYVDYGLGILTADAVLDLIPAEDAHDLGVLYGTLASRGQLQAYEVDQRFPDIGSASGLLELDRLLKTDVPQRK